LPLKCQLSKPEEYTRAGKAKSIHVHAKQVLQILETFPPVTGFETLSLFPELTYETVFIPASPICKSSNK